MRRRPGHPEPPFGLLHSRPAKHFDASSEPARVAIENARLFEKVRTQADTLLLLSEVSRETGSILEVEELLRRAAEQTKRVIDYQILSIMLYDENQMVFRHRVM